MEKKLKPIFKTKLGKLYCGASEKLIESNLLAEFEGQVQLIFTSPPFPLQKKKRYGNKNGQEYLEWLSAFAPLFSKLLKPDGSLVIEIGNAWEAGEPVQSLLPYKSLLSLTEAGEFHLCQEITYNNPARLPSPAQWVTIERIRLKDSTTKIWWLGKNPRPKANNRNVLKPYSKHMKRLLSSKKYNAGVRPSEHRINSKSFLTDNGGAIASNLIEASNTISNLAYQQFCREHNLKGHPARMPREVPEFFIKFLTSPNDLVLDPFAGSNTTGEVAESLGRKWISLEIDNTYALSSISRFNPELASKLLNS